MKDVMDNYKHIIIYFFLTLIICMIIIGVINNNYEKEIEYKENYIESLLNERKLKEFEGDHPITTLPFGSPLDSLEINSSFGTRHNPITKRWQHHEGIDLKGTYYDTVYTTGCGVVIHAGWCGGYGRCVEIYHGWNYQTTYAHLNKVFVKEGDTLVYRQAIGMVGNTGSSTGQHLHYEISIGEKKIDPLPYITTKISKN